MPGEITFRESDHTYWCDGLPVVGVTTAISMKNKPFLVGWAAKMCGLWLEDNWQRFLEKDPDILSLIKEMKSAYREKTKEAASIGTLVHGWVEEFIKGKNPERPKDERAQKSINAFLEWWYGNEVQVLEVEKVVFSKQHWYAGKMDFLAIINGKKTLADIKTSSGIYPEMGLQLAAYRMAYREMTGEHIDSRLIINIRKDGKLQTSYFKEHAADERGFLSCLELYKWDRDTPKPAIEGMKDEAA